MLRRHVNRCQWQDRCRSSLRGQKFFTWTLTSTDISRLTAMVKPRNKGKRNDGPSPDAPSAESGGLEAEATTSDAYATASFIENTLRRGIPGGDHPSAIRMLRVFPVNSSLFHARGSCVGKRYLIVSQRASKPSQGSVVLSLHGKKLDGCNEPSGTMAVRIHDFSMFGRVQRIPAHLSEISRASSDPQSNTCPFGMDSCESKLNAIFSCGTCAGE